MSKEKKLDHVNYDVLDAAKGKFVNAALSTKANILSVGDIGGKGLGASSNIFALNLQPFIETGQKELKLSLVVEGLGTADDARPEDLSSEEALEFWFNIGIKTASCMTNDLASAGLKPLLISLYLPSSTPEEVFYDDFMNGFLNGFSHACKQVGCMYFSGETPQLKNKIYPGKLDIAGAVFGYSQPGYAEVDAAKLGAGNQIVFVESSGPHENGFTGFRALAESLPNGYRTKVEDGGEEFWRAINKGSKLYSPLVQDILRDQIEVTNIEPISGHGWQKLMRSSQNLCYRIKNVLPVPPVFKFIEGQLDLSVKEMISVYNYGVGLAIYTTSRESSDKIVALAKQHDLNAIWAGEIVSADSRCVEVEPFGVSLSSENFLLKK